ncbi:MAG: hypothetical protein ACI8XZ_003402 [Gammaproteobacteria bacterium]|jgi:hypothetical protein
MIVRPEWGSSAQTYPDGISNAQQRQVAAPSWGGQKAEWVRHDYGNVDAFVCRNLQVNSAFRFRRRDA